MTDFKVADIAKAEAGRVLIQEAEIQMKGLMDLRKEYAKDKVLKEARIAVCAHVTVETAVFIETLVECGAEVRLCSCDVLSTCDDAAAALAKAGIPVFAWKGQTQEEFEWCQEETLKFKDGPLTLLIEDGGYIAARLHEKHPEMLDGLKGIVEQYTVGITKLYKLLQKGELKVPVIDCHQSATKSKFDHIYGCRESLVDGIKRATHVQIAGKVCVVCGYTDIGKGVAQSLRGYGARVIITEHDPILALQAAMEGYQVAVLDDVISDADIVITATTHIQVVTGEHIAKMKDHAIIGNIGQYDPECDVDWIVKHAASHISIKPQVDKYTFESGKSVILLAQGRLVSLGCAEGHPSFIMSVTFSTTFLAAIELYGGSTKKEAGIHLLPKKLDEQIAKSHLIALGGKLTELTPEQAEYLGVPIEGPYKRDEYRY